jgi:16S rRNA (cytosine1402-N4)-methyltransferase
MKDECCKYLMAGLAGPTGVFVDCTVGGGGHTKEILQRGGKVIGLDQDSDAIAEAQSKLSTYIANGQLDLIKCNFRDIKSAVSKSKLTTDGFVDGVLMDLGISSHQIDEPGRGFAFAADGPLDMRMGRDLKDLTPSFTAATIVNEYDPEDIADILYHYGDETRSRKIAREIVASRPLQTTGDLVDVISRVTAWKDRPKTLARCFQALRIVVNDEMGSLNRALLDMASVVRPGGRLVVLSYHSLEDRRVKSLIKNGSPYEPESEEEEKRISLLDISWKPLFKKAMVPSEKEIQLNRRSRSAKLRVAERVSVGSELQSDTVYLGSDLGKKNKYPRGLMGEKQLKRVEPWDSDQK